jgi:hypothetical protein
MLLFALVATAAAAAEAPLVTWPEGPARLTVARDGSFSVDDGAGAAVSLGRLMVFDPQWNAGHQDGADVELAEVRDGAAHVRARLTGPGKQVWTVTQTVRPVTGGWEFELVARPTAPAIVNEVNVVVDLPIARYAGTRLVLQPGDETKFPEQPPADHHFVSGGARRIVCGTAAAGQLVLDLDRRRTCMVQDTRQWKETVYQAFIQLLDHPRTVKPDEELRGRFTLRPADKTEYATTRVPLKSVAPLALGAVRVEAGAVGEPATAHVALKGTWDTPFWAEQVALDADITAPDGTVRHVPGFYSADFTRTIEDGSENLEPRGAPEWLVRWLPEQPGDYQLALTATDRSGSVHGEARATVAAGARRPLLRVSRTDSHYFEFDDGRPYFANGLNVCWYGPHGTADYDQWFGDLAANGGNYARVWMPPWAFGFEWGAPGDYRQDRCAQFDYVLALAQQKGIYLKVCLEFFRTFDARNPYAKANGGPCATVLDVFRDEAAKRMWRNRLRYVAARWGWSANILGWELWNEINCVQGYDAKVVQPWEREMAGAMKKLNPQHLTVSSLGSFVEEPELWRSPEMDWAQIHGYWHPSWHSTEFGKDMAQMVADHVAKIRDFGKPAFFAEFGLVDQDWGGSPRMKDDPKGVHLHNGLWAAMMAGAAGTAHLWWWDNYVAPQKLWWQFKPVAAYIAGVPFNTGGFTPIRVDTATPGLRVTGLKGTAMTLLWAQNRAHTWWNTAEHKPMAPVTDATVTIDGARGRSVEVWDTWTGERRRIFTADSDTLALGTVDTDVALKIR